MVCSDEKFQPEDFLRVLDFGVGCGLRAKVIGLSPSSLPFCESRPGESGRRLPSDEVESFGAPMAR